MTAQLFFIYDTHCPWSYATLPLVNELANAFPEMNIQLWHSARYQGDESIGKQVIESVSDESGLNFKTKYLENLTTAKDSVLAANVMSWLNNKLPEQSLSILNTMFELHFNQGNELTSRADVESIIDEYKLSPPAKIFNVDKLTKDAELTIHDIIEFQNIIGTESIPALLIAVEDNLILLNHNLYLRSPKAIVDAVQLEMK